MSNIQALVDALEKISKPIVYLQNEAEKQGCELDGIPGIQLSNNANWLSSIATQALADYHKSQKEDWISVEDDLPEYGIKVLVFGEQRGNNPQMGGAYISFGMIQDLKGTSLEKQAERHQDKYKFINMTYTTHWMPLPSVPNQGDVAGSQTNSIDKK